MEEGVCVCGGEIGVGEMTVRIGHLHNPYTAYSTHLHTSLVRVETEENRQEVYTLVCVSITLYKNKH